MRIESLTMKPDGEKFTEALGEDGVGIPQLIAQHNCAALMLLASQSFVFFLQHSIADMPFCALPEKGVAPATAPAARAKSTNSDVSHLFIDLLRLFFLSDACQVIESCSYIPRPLALSDI